MERLKWTQPLLIVLRRGRPEENVLQVCKHMGIEGDPGYSAQGCQPYITDEKQGKCQSCLNQNVT